LRQAVFSKTSVNYLSCRPFYKFRISILACGTILAKNIENNKDSADSRYVVFRTPSGDDGILSGFQPQGPPPVFAGYGTDIMIIFLFIRQISTGVNQWISLP
jgi:hypothetical protein